MESTPLLRQLIEYDHWANCEALTSLESLGERAERPRRIFCHVIGAQRIWLARFRKPESAFSRPVAGAGACRVSPCGGRASPKVEQCTRQIDPETLGENLIYRNTTIIKASNSRRASGTR